MGKKQLSITIKPENRSKLKKLRLNFLNIEHVMLSESAFINKLICQEYDKLSKECKNTCTGIK